MVNYTGRGLIVKRPGVLSKVQMLNLVLGVGVFSLLAKKTPEFTKMSEIHELFVLALSLVWFAGATPDSWRTISGKDPLG